MMMGTVDNAQWTYLFSIVRGTKEAAIYSRNGLTDAYKVSFYEVSSVKREHQNTTESDELDYCREIGEHFVMGTYDETT